MQQKSHWFRNLIILIVLSLLVWQYIIPYVDDSIKTPGNYINDLINPDFSESTWEIFVLDEVTNEKTYANNEPWFGAIEMELETAHSYRLGIETDLAFSFFGEYTWVISFAVWNYTSSWFDYSYFAVKIPAYQSSIQSVYYFPESNAIINYALIYSINVELTSPNGDYLSTTNMGYTYMAYQFNWDDIP